MPPRNKVGGTALDHLIKDTSQSLKDVAIDDLVRGEDQTKTLRKVYKDRLEAILWNGFTDEEFIINTAAKYDIVINTGSGFFPAGAAAFVDGLARRVKNGERAPWMIHIAGCTNLLDFLIMGEAFPEREWDDADGHAIYEFLKSEDEKSPYLQRTAEVSVLSRAEETGVQAVSLNTPGIYGLETGLFNQAGLVIPSGMRYAISKGFDLVYAFEEGLLPREETPKEKEIRRVTLKQMADEVTFGMQEVAERLVGHKAQKGTVAKSILVGSQGDLTMPGNKTLRRTASITSWEKEESWVRG